MATAEPTLSAADVRKVARLARLEPSDAEVEAYRIQLSAVLGYVERLRALDLAGVAPLVHVGESVNRLDPDEPGPTLDPQVLMRMVPDAWPPFIRVPKVIDEGAGA